MVCWKVCLLHFCSIAVPLALKEANQPGNAAACHTPNRVAALTCWRRQSKKSTLGCPFAATLFLPRLVLKPSCPAHLLIIADNAPVFQTQSHSRLTVWSAGSLQDHSTPFFTWKQFFDCRPELPASRPCL